MLQETRILHRMHEQFMKEFQAIKSTQDLAIGTFFQAHGGEPDKVINDDAKCAALIKLQNELTTTHNISTYAANASASANKHRIADVERVEPGGNATAKTQYKEDITRLRNAYRSEIAAVIQDNMRSFTSHLDLSLHLLSEDIKDDIHLEADRMINYIL